MTAPAFTTPPFAGAVVGRPEVPRFRSYAYLVMAGTRGPVQLRRRVMAIKGRVLAGEWAPATADGRSFPRRSTARWNSTASPHSFLISAPCDMMGHRCLLLHTFASVSSTNDFRSQLQSFP